MCNNMSNVSLSNGSPTLEMVDPRPTNHTKPPIRRNLFGSVDHDDFRRECLVQMKEMEKDSIDKWNYDFQNDKPLSQGDYKWEPMKSSDLPDFYSRPPHKGVLSSGNVDHNGNHDYRVRPSCLTNGSELSEETESERQTHCHHSHNRARKRPANPEPQSTGKKSHSSEEDEVVSKSVEQTPSKNDSRTHEH
ncbi:cyclin-dependent kinase inhibitor 1B [Oncorhynchus tshawytscha]|uniref:Cyclin-dependent kinase inhibitor 1B n=1 Tax=Oncorhynchus tshawytscha TaxID=74940 RepID=A0A8C8CF69_ONCTS|nr:cyclin-dependent kinase inhibitor 1B [Oncorhynchus tshawytscha]